MGSVRLNRLSLVGIVDESRFLGPPDVFVVGDESQVRALRAFESEGVIDQFDQIFVGRCAVFGPMPGSLWNSSTSLDTGAAAGTPSVVMRQVQSEVVFSVSFCLVLCMTPASVFGSSVAFGTYASGSHPLPLLDSS